MHTCLEKRDLASFAILDGHDRHVVLAPDLPTWDENQPPQYRKSPRLSYRLLRIPDTNPFAVELQMGRGLPQINVDLDGQVPSISLPMNTSSPIRSAAWKFHWPVVSRGTCACVGIKIHPNTPDSPVDGLLYWDFASVSPNRFSALSNNESLVAADFTMTLTVLWKGHSLLEASLTYHFVDLPPNAALALRREIWLGHSSASSITITPFISTAWGYAQNTNEMSEHEVNTESLSMDVRGINHTEGGWPKDVNYNEPEQVLRYRKKLEKDEQYTTILHSLANSVEHCIKQNNALNIYEDYFNDIEYNASEEPPSAKIVNVFRYGINYINQLTPMTSSDMNDIKRTASYVCWFPESPTKIAVAYSNTGFLSNSQDVSLDSYIWDFANPSKPDLVLSPPSALVCVEFNPKDAHSLIGGCLNGQLCLWDRRKGSQPVDVSPIETSHRDPAWQVIWIQSKTGTEFFSTSTDGQVLWWDVRKLSEPTEVLYLDPTKNQDFNCSIGAYALEYESIIPTKFMAGTEQVFFLVYFRGMIILCNRKGKTVAEKVTAVFPGHKGPVYALQRNPFFPKFFLSVGDWSARIWAEDMRDDPIMWTPYHESAVTDGRWSPVRPGLFFITRLDGNLELWDFVFKQHEPTLKFKLSAGFTTLSKNEKATVAAMFERESHREKILETRAKELRVKAKQKALAESGPAELDEDQKTLEGPDNVERSGAEGKENLDDGEENEGVEEELSPSELLKKIEQEFFDQIEEEKQRRQEEKSQRNQRLESLSGGDNDFVEDGEEEEDEDLNQPTANATEEEATENFEDPEAPEDEQIHENTLSE
ncbi:unnamed protein product [Rodentolepis nana]|uniref:Dynein intermediate chain 3, ciliary n=1 Tax=Rodentolepis nana TaxID=102285 RepID=A0A0R3T604_RODNA|nr:unnamed protein product [Rodentolepis nana]